MSDSWRASTFPLPYEHLMEALAAIESRVRANALRCEHCGERQWIKRQRLTEQQIEDLRLARIPMTAAFIHGRRCLSTCPLFGTADNFPNKGEKPWT